MCTGTSDPADKGTEFWTVGCQACSCSCCSCTGEAEASCCGKKSSDAVEKSTQEQHNKGHNPLNWLFHKRSRKSAMATVEQKKDGLKGDASHTAHGYGEKLTMEMYS